MVQAATQMTVMGPQTEKNSECFMSDGDLDGESSVEARLDFERMLARVAPCRPRYPEAAQARWQPIATWQDGQVVWLAPEDDED